MAADPEKDSRLETRHAQLVSAVADQERVLKDQEAAWVKRVENLQRQHEELSKEVVSLRGQQQQLGTETKAAMTQHAKAQEALRAVTAHKAVLSDDAVEAEKVSAGLVRKQAALKEATDTLLELQISTKELEGARTRLMGELDALRAEKERVGEEIATG